MQNRGGRGGTFPFVRTNLTWSLVNEKVVLGDQLYIWKQMFTRSCLPRFHSPTRMESWSLLNLVGLVVLVHSLFRNCTLYHCTADLSGKVTLGRKKKRDSMYIFTAHENPALSKKHIAPWASGHWSLVSGGIHCLQILSFLPWLAVLLSPISPSSSPCPLLCHSPDLFSHPPPPPQTHWS